MTMFWSHLVVNCDSCMVSASDSTLKDCNEIGHEEFQKWGNGGGTFHKSSSIDPTAIIEIGAVIHAESVVAANVHVGSGSIIGPAVTIGQSTRVGYSCCTILRMLNVLHHSYFMKSFLDYSRFLGIMLQSLIAQLVIFVFSTVVSALDKMVRLSVRFNGLDLNVTYYFLPILKFLLYTSKGCFLTGFGFFVDEQGKMVKKPQVGEILIIC